MKRNPNISVISMLILLSLFGSGCTFTLCDPSEYVVTRADDVSSGLCSAGNCSLRQAILASNACHGVQTVRIPAGTYILTHVGGGENNNASGDLDIKDSVSIVGDGMPVIDGFASDRVFDIRPGATVEMSGLVIQNGKVPTADDPYGGGIANRGNLTLTGTLIRNNVSRNPVEGGAGFYNDVTATASISHTAIVSNVSAARAADEGGGGVVNLGDLSLDDVTISGNGGYGIYNFGHLEIAYSTLTDNLPYQIQSSGSDPAVVGNSIVSGYPGWQSCRGRFSSNGFNIEDTSAGSDGNCQFTRPSDLVNVDPMLLPLSAYDGTTLPVHALDPSSPAFDSADPGNCSGTDQRGVVRPQSAGCDRGAYELVAGVILTVATPETATPTLLIFQILTETPTPAASPVPQLVFLSNANCRKGPGTAYDVATSFAKGKLLPAVGRNEASSWWLVQIQPGSTCWVGDAVVSRSGPVEQLPVMQAPPLPEAPAKFVNTNICDVKLKKLTVNLNWATVSGATGYNLYRNGSLLTSFGPGTTTYVDDAPLGVALTYAAEALNGVGHSGRVTTTVPLCK
jgi:hypothetical protein